MYIRNREYKTAQTWAKEINGHFKYMNINLDPYLVHVLFQKYGLTPTPCPWKQEVQVYASDDVYNMFRGKQRGNILGDAKKLTKDGTFGAPLKKGETREGEPRDFPKIEEFPMHQSQSQEDDISTSLKWQNGENDNDTYSEYLINKYQNESVMRTKKIYLTEEQVQSLLESQVIMESLFGGIRSFSDILKRVKRLAIEGVLTATLIASICNHFGLNSQQRQQIENIAEMSTTEKQVSVENPWELICGQAIATVYNAVPSQCDADCGITANMFRLNLNDVYSHRVLAIERTMMDRYGLKMGDVVRLEGVGEHDGLWQIQDKMNKRFAGMDKIDLLLPGDIRHGKWDNVKIYALKDKTKTAAYKAQLAPSLSKAEYNAQFI